MDGTQMLADRLLTRIDAMRQRFEDTGEDRWLVAAQKTERAYLRLLAAH